MGASAPDPEAGGVAVGAGAAVGVGAGVGVAVGAGGTGVAVGVGVGLEQAAMSAASANKIVQVDSFDMKAAMLLRLGVVPKGVLDMKKSLAAAVWWTKPTVTGDPHAHSSARLPPTCVGLVEQGLCSSA